MFKVGKIMVEMVFIEIWLIIVVNDVKFVGRVKYE